MAHDRIIAVGLLTAADLSVLGQGFKRAYPVQDIGGFTELLQAIDEADRELRLNPPQVEVKNVVR